MIDKVASSVVSLPVLARRFPTESDGPVVTDMLLSAFAVSPLVPFVDVAAKLFVDVDSCEAASAFCAPAASASRPVRPDGATKA